MEDEEKVVDVVVPPGPVTINVIRGTRTNGPPYDPKKPPAQFIVEVEEPQPVITVMPRPD